MPQNHAAIARDFLKGQRSGAHYPNGRRASIGMLAAGGDVIERERGGPMPITVIETPYGCAAVDALRDAVAALKTDNPMAPVVVIVPNNVAGIVGCRALAVGVNGLGGIAGIDVTTLSKLAERFAAPALMPRKPVTRSILAAAFASLSLVRRGIRGGAQETIGTFHMYSACRSWVLACCVAV